MNIYTIKNVTNSEIRAFRAGSKTRIILNEAAAKHIDWPIPQDENAEVNDENGKLFKNIADFAAAFKLELEAKVEEVAPAAPVAPQPTEETEDEAEEATPIIEDVQLSGTFTSSIELKAIIQAATKKLGKTPKVTVTMTITVGKNRPNGKAKAWLEPNTTVTSVVEEVKSKWIFLESQTYAKEFTDSTYVIE